MRSLNKLQFLLLIIVVLVTGILSFELINTKSVDSETDQFYCGTRSFSTVEDSAFALHQAGGDLFRANCKSCHKIHEDAVGPALSGITKRRPKKWIYAFVQDPMKLIHTGDTMAVNIYNAYRKAEMTAFPTITESEIDSILIYIEYIETPQPTTLENPVILCR